MSTAAKEALAEVIGRSALNRVSSTRGGVKKIRAKGKISRGLFGKRGKRLLVIPRVAKAIVGKKTVGKRTLRFLGATLVKNARVKGGPRKIRKDKGVKRVLSAAQLASISARREASRSRRYTASHEKNKKRYHDARTRCLLRCDDAYKSAVGNSRKRYAEWAAAGGRKHANRKAMSAESKAKLSALMKARWAPGGKFHGKSKTAGLAPPGDLNLQTFDW
jgi:hypothetical protein